MTSLFDITVSFTNETGKDSTIIAVLPFEKVSSKVQTPFTAAMTVICTPKGNIPEKEAYEVGFGGGISYITSDGDLFLPKRGRNGGSEKPNFEESRKK